MEREKKYNIIRLCLSAAILLLAVGNSMIEQHSYFWNQFDPRIRLALVLEDNIYLLSFGVLLAVFVILSVKTVSKKSIIYSAILLVLLFCFIMVVCTFYLNEVVFSITELIIWLASIGTVLVVQILQYKRAKKETKSTE